MLATVHARQRASSRTANTGAHQHLANAAAAASPSNNHGSTAPSTATTSINNKYVKRQQQRPWCWFTKQQQRHGRTHNTNSYSFYILNGLALLGVGTLLLGGCALWSFYYQRASIPTSRSTSLRSVQQQLRLRAKNLWHKTESKLLSQSHANRVSDNNNNNLEQQPLLTLEQQFQRERLTADNDAAEYVVNRNQLSQVLADWLQQVDTHIVNNVKGGTRWIRPYLLPPLYNHTTAAINLVDDQEAQGYRKQLVPAKQIFLRVARRHTTMKWQEEWDRIRNHTQSKTLGSIVDYTDANKYVYPPLPTSLQLLPQAPDQYPPLQSLSALMHAWPQNEDRFDTIHEQLAHFNYSNSTERTMAQIYRDHELPFKVYDVPELITAGRTWTDDYVFHGFSTAHHRAMGNAQESPDHFFAFFTPHAWDPDQMGLAPTRNNDWSYRTWAQHAHYADATRLSSELPHFYWQAGVDKTERRRPEHTWSFISRDLPSWSSPTNTFFVFDAREQKGIQCRFGERGVVAATHYDGGRNFVAMITGAKRYILSPPNQCAKLGVFTSRKSSIYRHSLLNFGHIQYLNAHNNTTTKMEMSEQERAWLERASQAQSVETVLKAGEALYIPSHWFHYIVSLQKSAQCNARSGIDIQGNPAFGNRETVETCRE
jgi:hypothetical protein